MKKILLLSAVFSLMSVCACLAQTTDAQINPRQDIFKTLPGNTERGKGKVVLHQDERIKTLVQHKREMQLRTMTYGNTDGFRVQVFSSNEQRTAKTQANKVEERVKARFPELAIYVSYASPFWKVRVGDCLTQTEATQLRDDLHKIFPDLKQSTYVVKDVIFIPE